MQENRRQVLKKRAAEVSASKNDEEINWDDVADLAEPSEIPTEMQDKLLNEYEKELKGQKSLKKELNIKENKITPDKGTTVLLTVRKSAKFSLIEKMFRQINYLVILLVKTLLSRNFCQKCVRLNFRIFHYVSVEKREISLISPKTFFVKSVIE